MQSRPLYRIETVFQDFLFYRKVREWWKRFFISLFYSPNSNELTICRWPTYANIMRRMQPLDAIIKRGIVVSSLKIYFSYMYCNDFFIILDYDDIPSSSPFYDMFLSKKICNLQQHEVIWVAASWLIVVCLSLYHPVRCRLLLGRMNYVRETLLNKNKKFHIN